MFAPNIQNVAVTTDATPDAQRQRLLAAALARKKMAEADTTTGRGRQQQQGFAPRNGGQMAAGLGMVAMGELLNKIATDRETEKAKEGAMAQADAMVTAVQSLGGPFANISAPALKGAFLTNPELASQVVKMGMENMLKPQERFETITLPDGRQAQRSTVSGKIEPMSEGKLLTPEQFSQQEALKKAGKAELTAKVEGNIPPGYRMERDQQGNAVQLTPIPGGPVAIELADKAKKEAEGKAQQQAGATSVFRSLNDIEKLSKSAWLPTTGGMGKALSNVPGTAAADIAATLTTIKANAAFDRLQAMRAASPTGGALGGVAVEELRMLQNSIAALEQSQSQDQFNANLARVRNSYEIAIHGKPLTPEERVKLYEMPDPANQKQPAQQPGNLQPAAPVGQPAPPAAAPVQGLPMPQEQPMAPQGAPQPAPQGLPSLDLIEQEILRRQRQQMQQQQQPSMPMVP